MRFVQVWSGQGGPTGNWDNHANIEKELPPMALATDRPVAGLLEDLKARGLLEDAMDSHIWEVWVRSSLAASASAVVPTVTVRRL